MPEKATQHQPLPQQRQPHHGPKAARYSDPKLSSNVYSKVSTEERTEAIIVLAG